MKGILRAPAALAHQAPPAPPSLALIDALKASACCLIVLHHLAFYGPMADQASALFPGFFAWLAQHARLAVQVFLVLGGYLAARAWSPALSGPAPWLDAGQRIAQRFIRLALPLWVALVAAVLCNALADHWMDHHSISGAPDVAQIMGHLVLMQDIIGHEALSAGVWYVAIDFQLYALLMLMMALARTLAQRIPGASHHHGCALDRSTAASAQVSNPWASRYETHLLTAMTWMLLAASAWWFNRQPAWDVAAPYFWVSYGLGVLLGLQARPRVMGPALLIVALAWWMEPRWRLVVAMGTAGALWAWLRLEGRLLPVVAPWVQALSRISYSVFLIHFPVSLVVNALWTAWLPGSPMVQLLGVITAFKLSLVAGWVFHRTVEQPLALRTAGWARLLFRRTSSGSAGA